MNMWLTSPAVMNPSAAAASAASASMAPLNAAMGMAAGRPAPNPGASNPWLTGILPQSNPFGLPSANGFGAPPMGIMPPMGMPMNTGMGMTGFQMPLAGGMGMSPALGLGGMGGILGLNNGLSTGTALLAGGFAGGIVGGLGANGLGGLPPDVVAALTAPQAPKKQGLDPGIATALVALLSNKDSKTTGKADTKTTTTAVAPAAPKATTTTTATRSANALIADGAPPISTAAVGSGDESILNVRPEAQRSPIGCVPTAVTMSLRYLGFNVTQSTLDAEMRPPGETASITDAVKAVERRGGYVGTYNNAKFSDVKRALDAKQPIIAYIENGVTSDSNLHSVVISGYYTDKKTGKQMLVITNPDGGKRQVMSYSNFQRQWQNLKVNNESTGFNQFMMVLSKTDTLPPSTLSGKALQVEKATYSRNQQARANG